MAKFNANSIPDRIITIVTYENILNEILENLDNKYPAKVFPVSSLGNLSKENISTSLVRELEDLKAEIKRADSSNGKVMLSPVWVHDYDYSSANDRVKYLNELLDSLSHFIDDSDAFKKNNTERFKINLNKLKE